MAATKRKSRLKKIDTSFLNLMQRVREGIFILSLALAVFLLLSLITFHRSDPSWSHTGVSNHVFNASGKVGAWFADILLYMFGYVAYLFPVLLVYGGLVYLWERNEGPPNYYVLATRTGGSIIIIISTCSLLNLQIASSPEHLPYTAGGILGYVLSSHLVSGLNMMGSGLFLIAIFLAGVTLFTGLSWLNLIEAIGWIVTSGVTYLSLGLVPLGKRLIKQLAVKKKIVERKSPSLEPVVATATTAKKRLSNRVPPTINQKIEKVQVSERIDRERQMPLFSADVSDSIPPLSLLDPPEKTMEKGYTNAELEAMSREVEQRLLDFAIEVQVVAVHPGPVVTRFEMQLAPGVKVSKISNLAKDLARSLSMVSVRIVDIIPGKSVVGLELPNQHREVVRLSEIISSQQFEDSRSPLSLALGKDIAGNPVIVDLGKMPHLLVAGTTGSGKSVGLNAMLLSFLFKATPNEVRLILIDPKMLEFSVYEGIPHLLSPVVTDMREAASALRWCVAEMERRYRLMAAVGVRNLSGFNTKVKEAQKKDEPLLDPLWKPLEGEPHPELDTLPYIVVVIDELADMMMVVGKKVEQLIARIAQKARAAGIHLILATQRPSVDVLTGLIKSNIPTRIAFQVSSKIDSRTILDQQGAEQLLGHGDMLYLPPGGGSPVRVHGAYVDDQEVFKVADEWRARGKPVYIEEIVQISEGGGENGILGESGDSDGESDPLYDEAVNFIAKTRRASISSVQRRFKIGYNRAARLIEDMEAAGVVTPMESNGTREVLAPAPIED